MNPIEIKLVASQRWSQHHPKNHELASTSLRQQERWLTGTEVQLS